MVFVYLLSLLMVAFDEKAKHATYSQGEIHSCLIASQWKRRVREREEIPPPPFKYKRNEFIISWKKNLQTKISPLLYLDERHDHFSTIVTFIIKLRLVLVIGIDFQYYFESLLGHHRRLKVMIISMQDFILNFLIIYLNTSKV
jgi:hypothetical protein